MKISKHVLAVVVLSIGFLGGAESLHAQAIENECASVFPWSDDCTRLTSPDGQLYYEAWERGYADDVDQFLGYVFSVTFLYEGSTIKLIIGLSVSKKISNVVLFGTQAVSQEFLAQFNGRSFSDSFEIATTTDDILFVPSKIKPMRDEVPFSQVISYEVEGIMNIARVIDSK